MVRVYTQDFPRLCNARNRPDNGARAATDPADRNVRHIGDDRADIHRTAAVAGAESVRPPVAFLKPDARACYILDFGQ